MCSEALPIARPTHHVHQVQSPTKYRTKYGQIRRLRVTAGSRTARTNAAMSTSRTGTAAGDEKRQGGSIDDGSVACDSGGDGHVVRRGLACASRAQTRVNVLHAKMAP